MTDLALLPSEIKNAQEMLTRPEHEAIKVGLKINAKKTEIMIFNEEGDNNLTSKLKTVN